jgi:hypothetical protein
METSILTFLEGYGPFAVLFFFLLYFILKLYNKLLDKAEAREEKLMQHIEKSDEHIRKSDDTQKEIAEKLGVIQQTQIIMQKDIEDLKGR